MCMCFSGFLVRVMTQLMLMFHHRIHYAPSPYQSVLVDYLYAHVGEGLWKHKSKLLWLFLVLFGSGYIVENKVISCVHAVTSACL